MALPGVIYTRSSERDSMYLASETDRADPDPLLDTELPFAIDECPPREGCKRHHPYRH